MPLSSESSNCRIDWRPSRLLCAGLVSMGVLAAIALWMSAFPLPARIPLALLALAYGPWLARREARRANFCMHLNGAAKLLVLRQGDRSETLSKVRVLVRGPLARVTGLTEDGRSRDLLWWPDTLCASSRRSLRLAASGTIADSAPALATIAG